MKDGYKCKCARCGQPLKHPKYLNGVAYGYICIEHVKRNEDLKEYLSEKE